MKNELISPKLDIVFKKIFGDVNNSDMLRGLVGAYLGIDTTGKFELSNTEITPEELERKFARLDLRISTDKSEIDVEVQVCNTRDFNDRSLYYWASLYASTVNRGDEYAVSRQALSLNIVDFKMFDCEDFNTNFTFYDPKNQLKLSEKAGISFIELPKVTLKKITPQQIASDERIAWAAFFNAKREEDFAMLNETTKSPNIQKAVTVIRELSADERTREEARKREEALFNERSALSAHYRGGFEKGLAVSQKKIAAAEEKAAQAEAKVEEMISNMKAMGMSEKQIEQILKSQNTPMQGEPRKSSPKHGRR